MLLSHCHWSDIEEYLDKRQGIIVPIGSTEQHGPNGLMGTDSICAEFIASNAGEQLNILVAPTISVGMAVQHLGFPGSMSLQPSTLMLVIGDIVNSLHKNGFREFYFVNGHGGNITTIYTSFSQIFAEIALGKTGAPDKTVVCGLFNWWQGKRVEAHYEKLYGDAEGGHATPSEIALANYAVSQPIRDVEMTPQIAGYGGATGPESLGDPVLFRKLFADGRIGSDPSLATLAAGEEFAEFAIADAIDAMREFFD